MKFKKSTVLLLTATLFISAVLMPSCGKKEDKKEPNEAQTTQNPAETTTAGEERLQPNIPDDVKYEDYTFTFLSHREESVDWINNDPIEIVSEAETGEPINDAVYRRNAVIKEKLGVDFKLVTNTDEKGLLNKSVKAGDNMYDAVIMFNNNVPTIITSDLLLNVNLLPYVDPSKPWWDDGVKSMAIAGKNYLLAGDMLILDNEATNAILFNKNMLSDYGLELPYNIVKEGKWTVDKLNEYVKNVSIDVNSDGAMDENDKYGMLTYNDTLHALLISGGGAIGVMNKDNIPEITLGTEKNLAIISKAMDLMYNKLNVCNCQNLKVTNIGQTYYDMFANNQAMFMWVRMRVIEAFRGMESDFGILPMPKYDELQDKYYSVVNPYTGVMVGIPKTNAELERTSIILEAMAAESRYTLQPAYYEVALTRKYARDAESEEMLNIIFNSRVYDLGGVYSFGNVFVDFITLASKYDTNITSYLEKRLPSMEAAIEKVVEKMETME